MLTHRIRTQVVVFVVIGLLAVSFIAVRYVGLLRVFGVGVYGVQVDLAEAGGIFPNAEVDYRGVPVGRVTAVRLTATGVSADLQLNTSAPAIPADVRAVVTDRSVIGEQFIDLRPTTADGPYLHDGSVIPQDHTSVPPTTNSLLTSADDLLRSLPVALAADPGDRIRARRSPGRPEPADADHRQPDVLPRRRPELPGHLGAHRLLGHRAAHPATGVLEHPVVQPQPQAAVRPARRVRLRRPGAVAHHPAGRARGHRA